MRVLRLRLVLTIECAVGSVVIVEVCEVVVGVCALSVGGPGADVCPFFEKDSVVSLNFAVGLGSAWPGFLYGGAGLVACSVPES